MALISVFCKDSTPFVLSCSEQHYLLTKGYSFVNLEFLVYFPEDVKEFYCAIHGSIIDKDEFAKKSRNKQNNVFLNKYVYIGSNSPDAKVFDFAKTFFWDIPTNKGYEGPFTQVKECDDKHVEIYGIKLKVCENDFNVEVDEENCASLITIKNKQQNQVFERGISYAFRIGSIINYYIPSKILPFIPYHIHYFSTAENAADRENFCKSFKNWGVAGSIKNCYFCTKISTSQGLTPLIKQLQDPAKPPLYSLHNVLNVPHSDMWLLVPTNWLIRKISTKTVLTPMGMAPYILYSSYGPDISFYRYHIKVSEDLSRFKDMSFIDLKSDEVNPFSYKIETLRLNILDNYRTLFAFMSSFSVAYIFLQSKRKAFIAFISVFLIFYLVKHIRDKYFD